MKSFVTNQEKELIGQDVKGWAAKMGRIFFHVSETLDERGDEVLGCGFFNVGMDLYSISKTKSNIEAYDKLSSMITAGRFGSLGDIRACCSR